MKVNFGGFIPLSTVDWRGRAVCTVFLRGCPVRCSYCHNRAIQEGEDFRETDEILEMMRESSLLVSGVIFSGGEPTMQREALMALCRGARDIGLATGIQTNGVYPDTLEALIAVQLVDRIALDIKARWERYENLMKQSCADRVKRSLSLCTDAHNNGQIQEFEVVITLFRGFEDEVGAIASEAGHVDIVLQQGVIPGISPLTQRELMQVADRLGRPVRIRTREGGETRYEGDRGRWIARQR